MTPPINLGILAASGAGVSIPYRIQTVGDTSGTEYFKGVGIDSLGNVYASGITRSNVSGQALIVKYDIGGNLISQEYFDTGGFISGQRLLINSNDDVLVTGYTSSVPGAPSSTSTFLGKKSSSGTLDYVKLLNAGSNVEGFYIANDSAGYYLAGTSFNNFGNILVMALDNNGNARWGREFNQAFDDDAQGLATDNSGNVYVLCNSNSPRTATLVKLNSSGSLQWQKDIGGSSTPMTGNNAGQVACNSSGEIFTVFGAQIGNTVNGVVQKIDSSGNIQKSTSMRDSDSNNQTFLYDVAFDSSDNVYVCGAVEVSGIRKGFLAKLNNNLDMQWQRRFSTSQQVELYNLAVDPYDNLYVVGTTPESTNEGDAFLAVLPNDGSLTGTYTVRGKSLQYSSGNLIFSSTGNTSSNGTFTMENRNELFINDTSSSSNLRDANLTTSTINL